MTSNQGFVGGDPTPGPLHPDRQIAANLMLDEPPTVTEEFSQRQKTSREKDMIVAFTTLTGYRESQIIGINEKTLTIVTASGGKYQLNRALDRFRTLSGPDAPRPKKRVKAKAVDAGSPINPTNVDEPNEDTEA